MFALDRELLVMTELVSAYSVTVSPAAWLVYLGSAVVGQTLIEAVYLHFCDGKSAWMMRRLNDSGAGQVRISVLMFAQDQYFRE